MSYLLGTSQPDDPVGYWLKPCAAAGVAHLVVQLTPAGMLRTACGAQLVKETARPGRHGVLFCSECWARLRMGKARRRRRWKNGSEKKTARRT